MMKDDPAVTGFTSSNLVAGSILLVGTCLLAIVYVTGNGGRKGGNEAVTAGDHGSEPPEKENTTGTGRNRSSDRETGKRGPLDVTRMAPGTYEFNLAFSAPVELPAASRGAISLYRGATEIDSGWRITPGGRDRISWSAQIGNPDSRLPPGLYRVLLSFSPPVSEVPDHLVRTVSPVSESSSFRDRVLSGKAWTYELGVQIGTREEIDEFERKHVRGLKRHGTRIIEAWTEWRNVVRRAYEAKRSNGDVPAAFPKQLLNTLKKVHGTSRAYLKEANRESSYLRTAKRSVRRKLRSFATAIPTKATALTVTMLRQLVGGVPADWPERYTATGFQSNIDVYAHMNEYHKQEVVDLRASLKNWKPFDDRFRSIRAYRRFRLRRLLDVPAAVREFRRSALFDQFGQTLPEETELRRSIVAMLAKYLRTLLRFHVSAYRETARNMGFEQKSDHPDLYEVLEVSLFQQVKKLSEELNVQVFEPVRATLDSARDTSEIQDRLDTLRTSAMEKPARGEDR